MIWRVDQDAAPMSSCTDEDDDGDTQASSPLLMLTGGGRRHSWGWHRAWTPLPHFAGLGHAMNPILYAPQLNIPPPPIVAPIPLGLPPPPYPVLPPPVAAPAAPAPVATWATTPVQAHVVDIPAPVVQPVGEPPAPHQAPIVATGGAPNPSPPPPPGSIGGGSTINFNNMSVGDSSVASIPLVRGHGPHQWVPVGGFHLPDLTSLTDTVTYKMWKSTIGYFHWSGHMDELIMPIAYQSIKGDVALDIMTHGPCLGPAQTNHVRISTNNFGVVSDEDTSNGRAVHHKAGSQRTHVKHFINLCWLCYDETGCGLSKHAMPTAASRRN